MRLLCPASRPAVRQFARRLPSAGEDAMLGAAMQSKDAPHLRNGIHKCSWRELLAGAWVMAVKC